MSLQETIKEQMKDAMRAKESQKVMTLRGLMSAFTNELLAGGKMPTDMLADDDALKVITKEAKKRKDSIQQFEDAGRPELAEDEKSELGILEAFLPELMGMDDIKVFAEAKKAELGMDDPTKKGMFIGTLMKELAGKADGNDVKTVVDGLFS